MVQEIFTEKRNCF